MLRYDGSGGHDLEETGKLMEAPQNHHCLYAGHYTQPLQQIFPHPHLFVLEASIRTEEPPYWSCYLLPELQEDAPNLSPKYHYITASFL